MGQEFAQWDHFFAAWCLGPHLTKLTWLQVTETAGARMIWRLLLLHVCYLKWEDSMAGQRWDCQLNCLHVACPWGLGLFTAWKCQGSCFLSVSQDPERMSQKLGSWPSLGRHIVSFLLHSIGWSIPSPPRFKKSRHRHHLLRYQYQKIYSYVLKLPHLYILKCR